MRSEESLKKQREYNKLYLKEYYRKNKERMNAEGRAWYWKNRKKVLNYQADLYRNDPFRIRLSQVKTKFGLSAERYIALKKKQKNRCAICRKHQVKGWKELAVDHDHETKKVRGLLCNNCNRALGMFDDSPRLLIRAAKYLKRQGK